MRIWNENEQQDVTDKYLKAIDDVCLICVHPKLNEDGSDVEPCPCDGCPVRDTYLALTTKED